MNLARIIQFLGSFLKVGKPMRKQLLNSASQLFAVIPERDGFYYPPSRIPETKEPYVPLEEVRRKCFYSEINAPADFYCGRVSGSSLPYFSSCAECFFHPETPFLRYVQFFRDGKPEKQEASTKT